MDIRFTGRRALVTGAAHGIGRGIAEALARDGAEVVGVDILAGELAALEGAQSGRIRGVPADLTSKDQVSRLVAEHGPFDILVHSAGGVCGQVGRPLEEIPEQDWHAILAINMTAAFLLAQAVTPGMKAKGYGRMVMISSGAGLGVSLTGIQAYAAAKAGEIGLTRQLAHELGQYGITVNSVAPGFVRSNPTTERQWESYGEDGQRQLLSRIATRRLGKVDDIANAVAFLVSEQAGWITGQTLPVDGGK
ncbi:SDR family oxidoreductase [Alsobacter sp. SYSU M60028]|uniref:SDR family oxidoreductase n=1 Tax=Alsobacter ponti TaxID=2962936 RepID=A0ABT1LFC1_9HYPH|nr:SDR family NAD(P)-dependent oxidoreductase [Alsobacter ponti]MCP8939425.1 SDR family oxidoreductase [Alsobacter ponti]